MKKQKLFLNFATFNSDYSVIAAYNHKTNETVIMENIETFGLHPIETELKESPGVLTDFEINATQILLKEYVSGEVDTGVALKIIEKLEGYKSE